MWFYTFFWLCFVNNLCGVLSEDREWKLVKSPQGSARGYKEPGTNVFAFYGIPYASAPIGTWRFKAPLPPPAWIQPLEATDRSIVCPQPKIPYIDLDNKKMQEDCLIVNVYVPDIEEKKLSVVVFIHGGSFVVGYGDITPPTNFVSERNVIGVTFNYRLGVNGFLCLGTPGVPGNAGLKDQVQLLRWVKRNIASYGGNPDNVTIIGCNAGAFSAELLMLSKSAKELFHKVIPSSGSNVGFIAMQGNPLDTAKAFAMSLNFTNSDDIFALEEFYKDLLIELLTIDNLLDNANFSIRFTPCVERDTKEEDLFIGEAPVDIIKRGKYRKVPMLTGFDECSFDMWDILPNRIIENFSEFLPLDLQFENGKERDELTQKIKDFYFGNKVTGKDNTQIVLNYINDILMRYPTFRAVKLHVEANHDKIYLYKYSFSEPPCTVETAKVKDPMECAQMIATLNAETNSDNVENVMESSKKTISEIWHNFIKTGKPVPEDSSLSLWPPVGIGKWSHMSLGKAVEIKQDLVDESFLFWDKIYDKYYRPPIPPPQPPVRHTEL